MTNKRIISVEVSRWVVANDIWYQMYSSYFAFSGYRLGIDSWDYDDNDDICVIDFIVCRPV